MTDHEDWQPDRLTWLDTGWRVLVSSAIGALMWLLTLAVVFPADGAGPSHELRGLWLVLGDPALGVVATCLMLLRRRWPVPIAVTTAALSGVSMTSTGAQCVAVASVATRRRWREIGVATVVSAGAGVVATRLHPELDPLPLWAEFAMNLLIVGIIVATGYAIGARRALVRSWVERARTSEAEQRARVAQAQAAERTRIAREMHDVLAHRISLVTMHSGVLAYRSDLPEGERRAAVEAIDSNARAALTDLREVLGVLRDPAGVDEPLHPQKTLQDLTDLLSEARDGGMRVQVESADTQLDRVPTTVSRTAYRVVQEGLTNARKHAPGVLVRVTLAGRPGQELEVTVTNPRPVGEVVPAVPGSGLGLLGLAERVDLAGGRIEHGWQPDGHHRLAVWLPWPA